MKVRLVVLNVLSNSVSIWRGDTHRHHKPTYPSLCRLFDALKNMGWLGRASRFACVMLVTFSPAWTLEERGK